MEQLSFFDDEEAAAVKAHADDLALKRACAGRAPYVPSSDTSREAAESIEPHLNALQRKVLEFIRERGAHGATDKEIQAGLGMKGSTQRPRRIELRDAGLIQPTGMRRDGSQVWRVKQ